MNTIKLLFLLLLMPVIGRGAGLLVLADANWKPATAVQKKGLMGDPTYTLVDFSFRSEGGAGMVLKTPIAKTMNKQIVDGAVTGFVGSVKKGGMTFVEKTPASVGKLKGVCVTTKGQANGQPFTAISYLVFSNTDMYTITIYGSEGMTQQDPLVAAYLSRIQMDSSVVLGNIDLDSPYEMGRKFGMIFTRYFLITGGVVILVIFIVIFVRRRNEAKPPPLPPG